ncbi:MAG: DUF1349 domain-containing protein [Solobacterium sp.]|nr:DUF1349 domain-containing protein [Solobacterium sp.]
MKRRMNPAAMQWVNKPGMTIVSGDKLIIETEPHTSLNGLIYGSRAAAILELEPMKNFTLDLRADYEFHKNEDECGILLKVSDLYWCKFCLVRRGKSLDLVCTVYRNGYGDRCVREVGDMISHMYFRVQYWNGNVRFCYSFNGDRYSDMRWLHLTTQEITVTPGVYACSPGDSWFDCTFSEMYITDGK